MFQYSAEAWATVVAISRNLEFTTREMCGEQTGSYFRPQGQSLRRFN